jgi:DNA-binding beta-propeller fold protein YncE
MINASRWRSLRRKAAMLSAVWGAIGLAATSIGCSDDGTPDTGGGGMDASVQMDTGTRTDAAVGMDVPEGQDVTTAPVEFSQLTGVGTQGFVFPIDAVPDPDANNVYFVALGTEGPAIFKVAAAGGAPTVVFEGDPLAGPMGINISTDGTTLYVADVGSEDGLSRGTIYAIPTAGGSATAVSGTENTLPVGIDVVRAGAADELWFTGTNPDNGSRAVMRVSAAGGARTVVDDGEPFVDLSGIAVDSAQNAYVIDTEGFVYKVTSGSAPTTILSNIKTGYPAGIALSMDARVLFVSARDPVTGKDLLYRVVLSDNNRTETFNTGIENFSEPGGLHRAHNRDTFAWNDQLAGMSGTVYLVTTEPEQ